jgi:hypothetical protein
MKTANELKEVTCNLLYEKNKEIDRSKDSNNIIKLFYCVLRNESKKLYNKRIDNYKPIIKN